jgi:hypothetical protein
MARYERFHKECTEAAENKNYANSKMIPRHKSRGIEEQYKEM